jgi:hypothetical protein
VEMMRSGWRDRREWRGERGGMAVVLLEGRRVTRHGRRRGVGVGWCGVGGAGADGKVDGTTGIISGIDDIVLRRMIPLRLGRDNREKRDSEGD